MSILRSLMPLCVSEQIDREKKNTGKTGWSVYLVIGNYTFFSLTLAQAITIVDDYNPEGNQIVLLVIIPLYYLRLRISSKAIIIQVSVCSNSYCGISLQTGYLYYLNAATPNTAALIRRTCSKSNLIFHHHYSHSSIMIIFPFQLSHSQFTLWTRPLAGDFLRLFNGTISLLHRRKGWC